MRKRLSIRTSTYFHGSIHVGSVQQNFRCCSRNSLHKPLPGDLRLYGVCYSPFLFGDLPGISPRLCAVHNEVNKRLKKVMLFRATFPPFRPDSLCDSPSLIART